MCDGDKCKKCGKFGKVGKGKWGSVKCGGSKGIKGSSVKVVAPKNYLQIAKAEIVGTSKCTLFEGSVVPLEACRFFDTNDTDHIVVDLLRGKIG